MSEVQTNEITDEQALRTLENTVKQLKLTFNEHVVLQQCVTKLEKSLNIPPPK